MANVRNPVFRGLYWTQSPRRYREHFPRGGTSTARTSRTIRRKPRRTSLVAFTVGMDVIQSTITLGRFVLVAGSKRRKMKPDLRRKTWRMGAIAAPLIGIAALTAWPLAAAVGVGGYATSVGVRANERATRRRKQTAKRKMKQRFRKQIRVAQHVRKTADGVRSTVHTHTRSQGGSHV